MVRNERSSVVFPALKNSRTDLSMRKKYYKLSNICSYMSIFLFGILFFITIGGCKTTEETVEADQKFQLRKKDFLGRKLMEVRIQYMSLKRHRGINGFSGCCCNVET